MRKGRKIFMGVVVIMLLMAAVFRVVVVKLESNLDELNRVIIEDVDLNNLDNGIYEGSYGSFPVSAVVEVTVKDHEINNIRLLDHSNGKGEAAEIIIEKVVEAQSVKVDVIAGATYSSRVILKAIDNALHNDQ